MFYDIFERLCREKGVKPGRAADEIGISRATVTNWKKNGYSPRETVMRKVADYYDVSVDSLLNTPETQKAPTLNKKDERDIARRLEETLNLLESSDALMFDGEPLDQESMDLLKTSLQNQYTLAKQIAKQKFTPKKYRTDNEK